MYIFPKDKISLIDLNLNLGENTPICREKKVINFICMELVLALSGYSSLCRWAGFYCLFLPFDTFFPPPVIVMQQNVPTVASLNKDPDKYHQGTCDQPFDSLKGEFPLCSYLIFFYNLMLT